MGIKTTIKDGKTWANIRELHPWEKNPKTVSTEDFNRLKQQKKLGQYKPLLVMSDGTAIGGNTRLKMYLQDGDELAYVSLIDFIEEDGKWWAVLDGITNKNRAFETKEQGMTEYALSDNDQIGRYDAQLLAELIMPYQGVMPLESYRVDITKPVDIQAILDSLQPSTVPSQDMTGRTEDPEVMDSRLETYLHGTIRQIVLYFTIEEYQEAIEKLERIQKRKKLGNNTEVFMQLLHFYEEHQNLDTTEDFTDEDLLDENDTSN